MKRSRLLRLAILVVLFPAAPLSLAHADITAVGNVSPSLPWTTSTLGHVGYDAAGTLTVDGGSTLLSGAAYLGHYSPSSSGIVTVSGSGSKWTSGDLNVGYYGTGLLYVIGGGCVSSFHGYVGHLDGATFSRAMVDGAGSVWNNSSDLWVGEGGVLYALGNRSLIITNGGSVSNSIGRVGGISPCMVKVDGAGSVWTNRGDLYLGYGHIDEGGSGGDIVITNGGSVSSSSGHVGYSFADGVVTVDGAGSVWNNSGDLYVGDPGGASYDGNSSGTLAVTHGGSVSSSIGHVGGYWGGITTVDGAGSVWRNSGSLYVGYSLYAGGTGTLAVANGGSVTSASSLYVGYSGSGTLAIANGGSVSSAYGYVGGTASSSGTVTVSGPGSIWTNSSSLNVGYSGTATLSIVGGGTVTGGTSSSINGASLLAIDTGRGSSFTVGSGTIANNGKVRILAGAGMPAGNTYSPISAGTWSGAGTYQAVGGTWDAGSHLFTASSVATAASGVAASIDLSQQQRILVTDAASGWRLGESFLATTNSSTLTSTATKITGGTLSSLSAHNTVLSGWDISAAAGYAAGDPVYLSFDVGHAQLLGHLWVCRYTGTGWSNYSTLDLTYDRTYASLTVTALGIYAVTGDLVLMGDANRDGAANGADLNAVLSNYNQTGMDWAHGDFDGNGTVNGADLNIVLSNYNQTLGVSSPAAVPEPCTLALLPALALAGLALSAFRRRGTVGRIS
jgi:T5SS/PEP-CTERM-associated repeat protein